MIAWVEVPVSTKNGFVLTRLDLDDYLLLNGRGLSLGSHGYAQLWADRKVQTLHRWLMGATGKGYRVIVDHINRDQLDNRRSNLRMVDASVSNINRVDAEKPYRGVYRSSSGRYAARIKWRRKNYNLGTYDTRDAAAAAINAFRREHMPETFPPRSPAA